MVIPVTYSYQTHNEATSKSKPTLSSTLLLEPLSLHSTIIDFQGTKFQGTFFVFSPPLHTYVVPFLLFFSASSVLSLAMQ